MISDSSIKKIFSRDHVNTRKQSKKLEKDLIASELSSLLFNSSVRAERYIHSPTELSWPGP